MAISGTITLGTDTTSNMTSFDLYPCTSSSNSSCSGTAFETNVSRTTLIAGFQTNNIPDGTLYIKINATNIGPCKDNNPAIIELSGAPIQVSQSPTPTLTKTPTPTPTNEPISTTITVKLNGTIEPSGNLECNTGTDMQVVINSNNFCDATLFTSSNFTTLGTNTYWISYNGYYRSIFHNGSENFAINSGNCNECVGIEPTYYYYAMGDCNDMRYSGTERTIFGFGAPITIPVCMTSAQINQWYSTANLAQQTLSIDYNDPCAFGEGYSGVAVGRSTTQLTEGTVYLVDNQCLSVISINAEYVGDWDVDLDNKTPIEGDNPCGSCDPPFTGFTLTGYSGVTCDTGENILAVTIFGSLVVGNVYGIQLYNGATPAGDARCMTINANLGPQLTITDPETNPYSGYHISDTGPFELGQPMFQGYDDCDACEGVVVDEGKYQIDAERCDDTQYSVTLWLDTAPTVVSGNTINISGPLSAYCWRVTLANQFKSSVGVDLGYTIIDTGCDCNGDNGGGNINVDNIVAAPTQSSNTGSECQSPQSQYYSETTITEMELTFRDSSNDPITPNDTVQYRVNGGSWTTLTVTSSTKTFSVTLIYGDNSACTGGGSYADTLEVKVGTITVLNYTAGQ